jgi:hypothetical protein
MMLQHSRDSNRFLNMIKNITAPNYYKKGTTYQTNQTINQPNDRYEFATGITHLQHTASCFNYFK